MTDQEDDTLDPKKSKYTARDAVKDGLLMEIESVRDVPVYITRNLYDSRGYQEKDKRDALVKRGLDLLSQEDPEDTGQARLRVVEKDLVWVLYDTEAITFFPAPKKDGESLRRLKWLLRYTGSVNQEE
jgi:hypothetical protein